QGGSALGLRRAGFGAQHFDGHGPIELSVVAEVDGAEAAGPQGVPHLITAEGRGRGRDTPRRRGRASIRTCPKPRKQLPDLRVDELDLLPPLPDLGEQLGAVAAHLLRRLAQFEDLIEQPGHLRVVGHRRRLLKLGACHRAAGAGGGRPAVPLARAVPRSGAAARFSGKTPTTVAASACVSPWIPTRSKTSRSSSGRPSITSSMRRASGLRPEAVLAGEAATPDSARAAAAGRSSRRPARSLSCQRMCWLASAKN